MAFSDEDFGYLSRNILPHTGWSFTSLISITEFWVQVHQQWVEVSSLERNIATQNSSGQLQNPFVKSGFPQLIKRQKFHE